MTNNQRIGNIMLALDQHMHHKQEYGSWWQMDMSFLLEMIKKYQQEIQTLEALSVFSITKEEVENWYREDDTPGFPITEEELTLEERISLADKLRNNDGVLDNMRDYLEIALNDSGFYEKEVDREDFGLPEDEVDFSGESGKHWLEGIKRDSSLYSNANGETEG